jgi:hypothetical protein
MTGKLFILLFGFVLATLFAAGIAEAFSRAELGSGPSTQWVALPEHNIELGLKPDGTVVWKQSLTNDGNVPYRTGP